MLFRNFSFFHLSFTLTFYPFLFPHFFSSFSFSILFFKSRFPQVYLFLSSSIFSLFRPPSRSHLFTLFFPHSHSSYSSLSSDSTSFLPPFCSFSLSHLFPPSFYPLSFLPLFLSPSFPSSFFILFFLSFSHPICLFKTCTLSLSLLFCLPVPCVYSSPFSFHSFKKNPLFYCLSLTFYYLPFITLLSHDILFFSCLSFILTFYPFLSQYFSGLSFYVLF